MSELSEIEKLKKDIELLRQENMLLKAKVESHEQGLKSKGGREPEKLKFDFDIWFEELLKEANANNKSASFIMFEWGNYNAIHDRFGGDEAAKIMDGIFSCISRVFAHPDDKVIIYEAHQIYAVLPDTNTIGASAAVFRLKEALLKLKFEIEASSALDFKIGLAVYPLHAQDGVGLIQFALEDIHRKKTILIVDDTPSIVHALKTRLEKQNYHIEAAFNGAEGLAHVNRKNPDLIVLDIMMAGMNGYELLGRLKQNINTAYIPVIFLTSQSKDGVEKESQVLGNIPIVEKTGNFAQSIDDLIVKMV